MNLLSITFKTLDIFLSLISFFFTKKPCQYVVNQHDHLTYDLYRLICSHGSAPQPLPLAPTFK